MYQYKRKIPKQHAGRYSLDVHGLIQGPLLLKIIYIPFLFVSQETAILLQPQIISQPKNKC